MDETIANRDTLLKDHIVDTYIELCNITSKLTVQIRSNGAGSKVVSFKSFEHGMYKIYNLSCVYPLGDDIKNEMKKWMDAKRKNPPSNRFMLLSIVLFEKFANELVVRKIIEV